MTRIVWRGRAKVPVNPGPVIKQPCSACGAENTPVILLVIDGIDVAICAPLYLNKCTTRYRKGMTPSGYQRLLKTEEAARQAGPIAPGGCGLPSVAVG